MAPLRATTLFLTIVAAGAREALSPEPRPNLTKWQEQQAEAKAEKEAVAARQKKMAAVGKVVELLDTLQAKILAEGEAEAKTYEKFACFCKDTTKERVEAIQKGEDDKAALSATIEELATQRDTHDENIQAAQDAIAQHEKEQAQADAERAATKKEYDANAADLKAALDALTGALKTLKASKTPASFAQLSGVSNTLRSAMGLAEALGLPGAEAAGKAMALLQQPANEVQMQDYDFHSDGIIETLEKLQDDFRLEKENVDKAEVESVQFHDEFTQTKTHEIKMANEVIAKTKKAREDTIAEIATTNQELSTVEASLLEDKEYTNQLSKMCNDKAKTWDQRSTLRANEVFALTQAIGIIKSAVAEKTTAATVRLLQKGPASMRVAQAVARDSHAMEDIEAEAEAAEEVSFVQLRSKPAFLASTKKVQAEPDSDGRQVIAALLKNKGAQLHSTLLTSLASRISSDPFAKVKVLIQELIERLLQEAANEANHKGWCDKALSDARQRRDYAAEEIESLNSEMAKLEARRDSLHEDLDVLAKEISEITSKQEIATEERDAESKQNQETVDEAQAGLDALKMCIEILDRFYKTAKKETVDLSLAQGPEDDAPDAGFDNGEAYLGAQAESGGILGMLDVMKSDFERTIEDTQMAEEQAKQDHLAFMTESGKSLAQKEEAEAQRSAQLQDAEDKFGEVELSLDGESKALNTALVELIELKPVCLQTGMTYQERVEMRKEEIEALKKAMCILEQYAQYGPEGAGDSC